MLEPRTHTQIIDPWYYHSGVFRFDCDAGVDHKSHVCHTHVRIKYDLCFHVALFSCMRKAYEIIDIIELHIIGSYDPMLFATWQHHVYSIVWIRLLTPRTFAYHNSPTLSCDAMISYLRTSCGIERELFYYRLI